MLNKLVLMIMIMAVAIPSPVFADLNDVQKWCDKNQNNTQVCAAGSAAALLGLLGYMVNSSIEKQKCEKRCMKICQEEYDANTCYTACDQVC